jgi:hypothetical protein
MTTLHASPNFTAFLKEKKRKEQKRKEKKVILKQMHAT